jgi:hypothetical protein
MLNKPTEKNFLALKVALREGRREMGEATYQYAHDALDCLRKQMRGVERLIANARADGFQEGKEAERALNA